MDHVNPPNGSRRRGRATTLAGLLPCLLAAGLLAPRFFLPWAKVATCAPTANTPAASHVIHRRATTLHEAILVACGSPEGLRQRTGALIVDGSPHVRKRAHLIRDALNALSRADRGPTRWRVARLGGPLSPAVPPRALTPLIAPLFQAKNQERNTFELLGRTVRSIRARRLAVVYIADWQFEDEHRLERFIKWMKDRGHRFGVVGSEAAFGRAWNDGVLDARERMRNFDLTKGMQAKNALSRYDPTIGRAPFGPTTKDAPWHGGDTAYPHLPYRFSNDLWKTELSPRDLEFERAREGRQVFPDRMEDLLERRGRHRSLLRASLGRDVALPSSFGPYGLMRAAGVLGGTYVLWSWNPTGRSSLVYDFSRCNLFGPDLRSRKAIASSLSRNGLARGLLKAWHRIGSKFDAVSEHTPPMTPGGRPAPIDLLDRSATQLQTYFRSAPDVRAFLNQAHQWKQAIRNAQQMIRPALVRARAADHAPTRLRADADLAMHIFQVLEFELGEAIVAAQTVTKTMWSEKGTVVILSPRPWILRGDDLNSIRKARGVIPWNEILAARVEAARATQLRRYATTPFGVQVAANTVDTYGIRISKPRTSEGQRRMKGRGLAESDGDDPQTPPSPRDDPETEPSEPRRPSPPPRGASSGGGGPQSGGG